jgi:predicted nuclease of predicted toxin-antitoxin system
MSTISVWVWPDDLEVWKRAKDTGFCIVSKDSDYYDLSVLQGQPPKVIWLRLGNCTTRDIFECLRNYRPAIDEFGDDASESVLLIP